MFERHTSVSRTYRILFLLIVVVTTAVEAHAGGRAEGPEIDAEFFFMEICPLCETYQTAEQIAGQLATASREHKNITTRSYNLVRPDGGERLVAIIEERGLPDISYLSPVLIVNTTYIVGYEEIEAAVEELLETGDLASLHEAEG